MSTTRKRFILLLIAVTSLPFFLLLFDVDYSYYSIDVEFFYFDLAKTLGSIFGLIGAVFMMWQFVLGTRYIAQKISPDVLWLNKIHKNLGIYGTLFVFIHPFIQMYVQAENLAFVLLPGSLETDFDRHVAFGRMALFMVAFIWITSAVLRKKIAFRPWKYIHYIAYVALFFVFLHALEFGTVVKNNDFVKYFWIGLFALYHFVILYRIAMFAGIGKKRFTISKIIKKKGGINIFYLRPVGKRVIPKVGQYAYIQMRRFGEEHPFTVVECDKKTGDLVFGIRESGKFTKKLGMLSEGDELFLDGPYGVFTKEGHNSDPKVLIAGGVGVTPFVRLVEEFGDEHTYMLNCNRRVSEAIFRSRLKEKLGGRYFDIISDDKNAQGDTVIQGFLDKKVIADTIPHDVLMNGRIFFCGNPGFYRAICEVLDEMGVSQDQIFYEEFSV